jgi:hypothetical protein
LKTLVFDYLQDWRRIFVAIQRYAKLASKRFEAPVQNRIVWHGGEPLLLPLPYMEEVVAMQREVFGPEALASGNIRSFKKRTKLWSSLALSGSALPGKGVCRPLGGQAIPRDAASFHHIDHRPAAGHRFLNAPVQGGFR